MLVRLRNLLARPVVAATPSIPEGERVYAIGDIHGCLDLFEDIVHQIEHDNARRGPARTTVVFLGDMIDRGAESAAVIAGAREWARHRRIEFVMGNHEEMLLRSRTDVEVLRGFLKYGGLETIQSYGIASADILDAGLEELQVLMIDAIPEEDFEFIAGFKDMVTIGDYLFVHAGIRPGVELEHQTSHDCHWIRDPFLSHKGKLDAFVIHGHTMSEEPDVRAYRAGIDTGAYVYGTLTAIGLEGEDRWFLQARNAEEFS